MGTVAWWNTKVKFSKGGVEWRDSYFLTWAWRSGTLYSPHISLFFPISFLWCFLFCLGCTVLQLSSCRIWICIKTWFIVFFSFAQFKKCLHRLKNVFLLFQLPQLQQHEVLSSKLKCVSRTTNSESFLELIWFRIQFFSLKLAIAKCQVFIIKRATWFFPRFCSFGIFIPLMPWMGCKISERFITLLFIIFFLVITSISYIKFLPHQRSQCGL